MDIYQTLKKDHDQLKPLLDQLVNAKAVDEDTHDLIKQIRDELVSHSRAEEAVFYNSLRQIDMLKEQMMHSYEEHAQAEMLLRALQAMEMFNADWTKTAKKLREAVLHHVEEEEGRIFSMARQVLIEEEARQMADAFNRLKPEVKEQGFLKNTLDMIANVMPTRFAGQLRSYTHKI